MKEREKKIKKKEGIEEKKKEKKDETRIGRKVKRKR